LVEAVETKQPVLDAELKIWRLVGPELKHAADSAAMQKISGSSGA
jgi:hypothetical protein